MVRRNIEFKVEPSVLKYARYLSGFDIPEASEKIGVKEAVLASWEEEITEISIARLEKITRAYKMPLAYFFLDKIPSDVVLPDNFRIVYESGITKLSPSVMLAVRRARYVQSVIQEIDKNATEIDFKKVSISDDIEKIASHFRSVLAISLEQQSKWSDPGATLRNWKNSIERLGIFVLQQSLSEDDVSAFCLVDQKPFIIVLNSSEHENRRIFSLFHELGHILLHQSGVCTPDDLSLNSFEYKKIEKFCNQFAASLLVPLTEFSQNSLVQKLKRMPFENWQGDDILAISKYFRVSREVIYRRLVTVGILDERKYEAQRNELIQNFEEYKKKRKGRKVIIPQYLRVLSQNGQAYSSFVLNNLHTSRITLADAASFLGTNWRHISRIEEHI